VTSTANNLNIEMIFSAIAKIVIVLVTSIAFAPHMTAINARKKIGMRKSALAYF
jgi:hypothetical protein